MGEVIAHILLSIVASAVIAGVIKLIAPVFHEDPEYLLLWVIVFCAWWGIILIDN